MVRQKRHGMRYEKEQRRFQETHQKMLISGKWQEQLTNSFSFLIIKLISFLDSIALLKGNAYACVL